MKSSVTLKISKICISIHQKGVSFFDWIWPSTPKKFPEQIEKQNLNIKKLLEDDLASIKTLSSKSVEDVRKSYKEVLEIVTEERTRTIRVENKLATLFVLSVVSATLVLSAGHFFSSGGQWVVLIPMGYCLLQLLRTLSAVIDGMKRQSYYAVRIKDLIPSLVDTDVNNLVNLMKDIVNGHCQNEQVTNKKVTALAIAHKAVKNFLVGLSVLFIFLLIFPQAPENHLYGICKKSVKASTNLEELNSGVRKSLNAKPNNIMSLEEMLKKVNSKNSIQK